MRKPRVWDKVNKKMHYDIVAINWECEIVEVRVKIPTAFSASEKVERLDIPFENCVIMDATGLRDKNGREIYEGDIVRYTYLPGKTFWNFDGLGIVKWASTGFKLEPLPGKGGVSSWLVGLPGLGASEKPNELLEVIGNVHDNPELLK